MQSKLGHLLQILPTAKISYLAIARSGERTELPSKIFNLLLPQVPENAFILSKTDRLFLGLKMLKLQLTKL